MERTVDGLGRIVLPKEMREQFGICQNDVLQLVVTEEGILIKTPGSKKTED